MGTGVATVLILASLAYGAGLLVLSRHRRPEPAVSPDGLFFVFVVPCLNEERVIGASLDRLLAFPGGDYAVLVVDDASDDATAAIVGGYDPARVWLLQRRLPDARAGKGAALNAAFRHLCATPSLAARDPRDVVLVVVDADGRLAANALTEVSPFFSDPRVGAVQVGVRMYNADQGLLARMQDFEFVTFTEIFQRARQRIGSVGLGGNGQFTRLLALQSLGSDPWSSCLTEDLDLGLQLLARGWDNCYCPTSQVDQQAIVDLRRLLRQRARWFQGHLQCWKMLPSLSRSSLRAGTIADVAFHLLAASLVLVMSVVSATFLAALVTTSVLLPAAVATLVTAHDGLAVLVFYGLTFGMAWVYGAVYWLRDGEISLSRAIVLGHFYTAYSYLWAPSGWWAVWRCLSGRTDWAKTARSMDPVEEAAPC